MNATDILREKKSGKLSSTRLVFVFWGLGSLIAWLAVSYNSRSLVEFPQSVITLLGLLVGGKAIQRFGENESLSD